MHAQASKDQAQYDRLLAARGDRGRDRPERRGIAGEQRRPDRRRHKRSDDLSGVSAAAAAKHHARRLTESFAVLVAVLIVTAICDLYLAGVI